MTISQIRILGLFNKDDLVLQIMRIIDNGVHTDFNVEVIQSGVITFFCITVSGEFEKDTARNLINSINTLIGNCLYDDVQVTLVTDRNETEINVDGNHDIVI